MPLGVQRRAMKRVPHLMRTYQPPVALRKGLISSQAEDSKRRKTSGVEVEAALPFVPKSPKDDFIPRDTPDLDDRFHKNADGYTTVANAHVITADPVRLPGRYEFIQEAIDNAATDIVPKLAPNQRHAIIVHGGTYEEDITINSPQIDLYGLGRPKVIGKLTSDIAVTNYLVEGFELDGNDDYAVDIPGFADPEGDVETPLFYRCNIHSKAKAFRSFGRVLVGRSRLAVDYLDEDYTNLDSEAIEMYLGTHERSSEFYRCRIEGAPDRRTPEDDMGFPNRGRAWHLLAKPTDVAPVYLPYQEQGVLFRYCKIRGYGWNEAWKIAHDHCQCYGGKKHLTAGEVYMFNTGWSMIESPVFTARAFFDHTHVACRYLVQEGNAALFPFGQCTEVYLQHFKQLQNSGDYLGSMIVPANTLFTGYGNVPGAPGACYGEHSITWRMYFNGPLAVELGVLCNCDSEAGHHINTNFAFGAGTLGTILTNPYKE